MRFESGKAKRNSLKEIHSSVHANVLIENGIQKIIYCQDAAKSSSSEWCCILVAKLIASCKMSRSPHR